MENRRRRSAGSAAILLGCVLSGISAAFLTGCGPAIVQQPPMVVEAPAGVQYQVPYRQYDPCLATWYNEVMCDAAFASGGYSYGGSWYPYSSVYLGYGRGYYRVQHNTFIVHGGHTVVIDRTRYSSPSSRSSGSSYTAPASSGSRTSGAGPGSTYVAPRSSGAYTAPSRTSGTQYTAPRSSPSYSSPSRSSGSSSSSSSSRSSGSSSSRSSSSSSRSSGRR